MSRLSSSSRPRSEREVKERQIQEQVAEIIERKGGVLNVRSRFLKEVAREVVASEDRVLDSVRPNIRIEENDSYTKAMGVVIAYLRRYRMEQTIQTMKTEGSVFPKSTGISRASELEQFFASALSAARKSGKITFDEKVDAFKRECSESNQLIPESPRK